MTSGSRSFWMLLGRIVRCAGPVGPVGLAGLAVLASLTGCAGPGHGSEMVSIPPPPDWVSDLQRSRLAKDDYFRSSPETPLLPGDITGFGGLDYFGPDAGFYFIGDVHYYPEPQSFAIISTAGVSMPCEKIGWIEFPHGQQSYRLQVYRLPESADPDSFFLPFTDGTTGDSTYPAGRYVELNGPRGGPYVLDFNRAYSPSCAYGDPSRFSCPSTPPENRLDLTIEAGERGVGRS